MEKEYFFFNKKQIINKNEKLKEKLDGRKERLKKKIFIDC